VGVTGGTNYSTISLKSEIFTNYPFPSRDSMNGQRDGDFAPMLSAFGGLVIEIKITNAFSIKSNLLFISKGWKEKVYQFRYSSNFNPYIRALDSLETKEVYRLNYFELPLHFTFSAPIKKTELLIGVGPYVAYAISGNYTSKIINDNSYTYNTIVDSVSFINFRKEASSNSNYKGNHIDYGASITLGLKFRTGFYFESGYKMGLKDVILNRFYSTSNRNKVGYFAVGYYLFQSKKS